MWIPLLSVAVLFSSEKMLFLHKNIYCGYSLEAPQWGASNEYPQHKFSSRNKKTIMWILPPICSYDICGYVTLVTRFKQMFKFTFKFTLTFTSAFLLEVITWVLFMLGSWNLLRYLLRPKASTRIAPVSWPWVWLGSKCLTNQIEHLESSCRNLCIQMLLPYGQKAKGGGLYVLWTHVLSLQKCFYSQSNPICS